MRDNPVDVALELIRTGFTVERYEAVQSARKKRLAFWREQNVEELIKRETELIQFGNQVIKILKEHENNK